MEPQSYQVSSDLAKRHVSNIENIIRVNIFVLYEIRAKMSSSSVKDSNFEWHWDIAIHYLSS